MSNPKTTLIKQIQQLAGVENVSHLLISPESDDFMVVEICFSPESVVDRLTPEEVAIRNYEATIKRGKINDYTKFGEFTDKIKEEIEELIESYDPPTIAEVGIKFDASELADIVITCESLALHYGIDLQAEKEKKMFINEQRKD